MSTNFLAFVERMVRWRARTTFWILARLKAYQIYQPAPWVGVTRGLRAEGTEMRWKAMEPILREERPGSAMDLGAQVGYFTFKLAERGHLTLGVENSKRVCLRHPWKDHRGEPAASAFAVVDAIKLGICERTLRLAED